MECYYLVNVREYQDRVSGCVFRQPLLDDMKIPDFTYVYDIESESESESEPDGKKVVFCHLRGFFSLDDALVYLKSFEAVKKKLSFFLPFKSAFFALDD